MLISKCNLCNYTDDNILYSTGKDLNRIRRNLEMYLMILHEWFHENHMTLNPGKCHYIVIGNGDLSHEIMLNNSKITSSNEEKLLGIFVDSKLHFESHIGSLCRKVTQKINALATLKNSLASDQRKVLLNSVIESQSTYCPLTWMFTSRYPQRSILGPLLFNILLCDLFLIMENIDIASHADDNTPYTTGNSIEKVI